jgi:hypothetical protein
MEYDAMELKEMKELVEVLTPATSTQLDACCAEEEVLLVGALASRGVAQEVMAEILHEYRRLSARVELNSFAHWQEMTHESLFRIPEDHYFAPTFEEYKKAKSKLLQNPEFDTFAH